LNATSRIHYCRIEYALVTSAPYPDNAGGGIGFANYSNAEIRNCRISNCNAFYGGGIGLEGNSSPVIVNNLICNNTAMYEGGGINCYYNSSPAIIGNVIVNNTNQGYSGGGINFYSSSAKVINNTIVNNVAGQGAGIMLGSSEQILFVNNIIWGNKAGTAVSSVYNGSSNPNTVFRYNDIEGGSTSFVGSVFSGIYANNLNVNPQFYAPTTAAGFNYNAINADFSLNNISPCINAGIIDTTNLGLPLFDISQLERIRNNRLEIGAYEWVTVACGTLSGNPVWSDHIRVKCTVVVPAASTLTINAGTIVEFANETFLNVSGRVLAVGNIDNKIVFAPINKALPWKGIRFTATTYPTDSSKFEFCIIRDSWARSSGNDLLGGGFYLNYSSKLLIRNCIISNNRATTYGGGVYINNASPSIVGNLIINNNATTGGGIYVNGTSSPLIVNNTIAFNFSQGIRNAAGTAVITGNIIYSNSSSLSISGTPTITYNCIQGGYSGTGNISTNPLFKNPPTGIGYLFDGLSADFDLQPTSPCINMGNPVVSSYHLPVLDLAGKVRLLGTVDIGAYEYVSSMTACGTISQNTVWNTNFVNVNCDVIIPSGVTLTINPGTIVEFQGNYKIVCNGGSIKAIGNIIDSVKFRPANISTGWGGVRITGASADSSVFDYTGFSYAKVTTTATIANTSHAALSIQSNDKVRIENTSFYNNTTINGGYPSYGGAVFVYNAGILINKCHFKNNTSANYGGGIGFYYGNSSVLSNCIFFGNNAVYGGGVYIYQSTSGSNIRVVSNHFYSNTSTYGAAMCLYYGTGEITNNLMANNQASYYGGAVYAYGNTARFANNTIVRNKAQYHGGGFYLGSNSDIELYNCIVWGNEGVMAGPQFYISDIASDPKMYNSFIHGGTAAYAGTGSGIEYEGVYQNNLDGADPLLSNPTTLTGTAGNPLTATFNLNNASPCINSGTLNVEAMNLPATDLLGNPRIYNGVVDMGAYENQTPITACGTITSYTYWNADTVFVNCDVVLNDVNANLKIKPGAVVVFMGEYKIRVIKGNIIAIGTPQKNITFTRLDTSGFSNTAIASGGWMGIQFTSTYNLSDSSKFEFCNFSFGKAFNTSTGEVKGGAIYVYNFSKLYFKNCKFINNHSKEYGGAVYCESASPTFINNLFAHNSCHGGTSYGGAMYLRDAGSLIMNNTFANNYANIAGAITFYSSNTIVRNNVFWGNSCSTIYVYSYRNFLISLGGVNTSQNNIIEGGTSQLGGWLASQHSSMISLNPLYVSPLNFVGIKSEASGYDYSLLSTSPAVNAGSNNSAFLTGAIDLAGNTRNVAGALDIGAYEMQIAESFITSHPQNVSVCVGMPVNFSVNVSIPVNFQWRKNGANISGANSNTLTIPVTTANDSGSYSCQMSNENGTIVSNTAYLQIKTPPAAAVQPQAQSACTGQNAMFYSSANGTEPINYQWYNALGMIPGAVDDTLILNNISLSNASSYYTVFTNQCGSSASIPANLVVNSQIGYTSQSPNANACPGQTATFSVTATGTAPFSYQWYKKSAIPAQITVGTGNLVNSQTTYPSPYGNWYWGARHQFIIPAAEIIAAGGSAGSIKSLAFNVASVQGVALQDFTIKIGTSALDTFASTIFTEGLQTVYSVASYTESTSWNTHIFDTPFNWNGSSNLIVEVCFNNTSYTYNATVYQTATLYGSSLFRYADMQNVCSYPTGIKEFLRPNMKFGIESSSIVPSGTNNILNINGITQNDEGIYYCLTSNVCGSLSSNEMNLNVKSLPNIDSASTSQSLCVGSNALFMVTASGTGSISYQWYKGAQAIPGAISSVLQLNNIQTADQAQYNCRVSNECGYINSTDVTLNVLSPISVTAQSGNMTACAATTANFSLTASGSTPISYQWYGPAGSISGATNNSYTTPSLTMSGQGNYYCVATNACGSVQTSNVLLNINSAPVISQQPSNTMSCVGQSTVFSVVPSGVQTYSYQWYKNAQPITGAINNVFLINSTTLNDSANYYCVVTNQCGNTTSSSALLTVKTPITIISQSADSSRCVGGQMTFSLNATGSSPITYQWYRNNYLLPGVTSSTYSLNNISMPNAGYYHAFATNACGIVSTTYKTLTVHNNPVVNIGNDTTFCFGSSITLSPGAGYNCVWSNGSLNPQLPVTTSGAYSVSVTDANGCTGMSNTINLTIPTPYADEEVCIVTVDSATKKNTVVWEKTPAMGIAYYKVYKESSISGIYNLVAMHHVDSLSAWIDANSSPSVKADRYRISTVDTCGNESVMSIPHKTMHLTVNAGPSNSWNLIWDKYEGFTVPTYRIWRADTTLNFVLIDSVQGTSFTYSDINPPAGGLYYVVELIKPGGPCIATNVNKAATGYNSSRSNQADNGLIVQLQLFVDFFAFPSSGLKPLQVQFVNDSDPAANQWNWSFGDGDSSNVKNPLHLYDSVGVFDVTLYVSDGQAFNTQTKNSYITVLPVGVESCPEQDSNLHILANTSP
jgi:predicted outer membrane repeat protein/parallel beta-helix repeat protein